MPLPPQKAIGVSLSLDNRYLDDNAQISFLLKGDQLVNPHEISLAQQGHIPSSLSMLYVLLINLPETETTDTR